MLWGCPAGRLTKVFRGGFCQVSLCVLLDTQRPEGLALAGIHKSTPLHLTIHSLFSHLRELEPQVQNFAFSLPVWCFTPDLMFVKIRWSLCLGFFLPALCFVLCKLRWRLRTSWYRMFPQEKSSSQLFFSLFSFGTCFTM